MIDTHLGVALTLLAAALLLCVLPASIVLLALTANPFTAASPAALVRLIHGMGRSYAALLLALLTAVGALALCWATFLPLLCALALSLCLLMLLFAALGAVVHQSRWALGLEIRTPEEQRSERAEREHSAARRHVLDRAYGLVRLKRREAAWREIQAWIAPHGRSGSALREYVALLEAAADWDDPVVGDRLADEYIARLLAQAETGHALEVLTRHLAKHPGYRPALAKPLAGLAAAAGRPALRRTLDAVTQADTRPE